MQLKSNAPEIKWIIANAASNDFAASCDRELLRSGTLSENRLAAVQRGLERETYQKSAAERAADVSGVQKVVDAFNRAIASGLKRPKMYLDDFLFKLAPSTGRNAGSIYVTEEGDYLGKISEGKFHPVRECTDDQKARIIAVCADPMKAAEAFGQETGRCSMCGLELTDPVSIAQSMGPICSNRYFSAGA
jgi:hypothetical protein